jgi:SAM-dependent methyltransferase
LAGNAERFSGFADLYDRVRPTPPPLLADIVCGYAGVDRPAVVDLGSGTGLSTRWIAGWASAVVGVEPSEDMRQTAIAQNDVLSVSYVDGWAHDTGLPDECADVAIASQALHWMEPESTFAEVARLLRPGGVFAAIDCDWPPSVGSSRAEAAWEACRARVRAHGDGLTESVVSRWSKDGHLARMVESARFTWCREVVVSHTDQGDAARFVALLESQGDYQTLRKHGVDERSVGVDEFAREVAVAFGDRPRPFWWSYRMQLGVI